MMIVKKNNILFKLKPGVKFRFLGRNTTYTVIKLIGNPNTLLKNNWKKIECDPKNELNDGYFYIRYSNSDYFKLIKNYDNKKENT